MNAEMLKQTANTVIDWCSSYGYNVLRYPENLRWYARKQMPEAGECADLLADVVSVDGAVNCLMWCRYYAKDAKRLVLCTDAFARLLRETGRPDADELENAFRFLVAAAIRRRV